MGGDVLGVCGMCMGRTVIEPLVLYVLHLWSLHYLYILEGEVYVGGL